MGVVATRGQNLLGMEICEATPIILGGDPVDPANKVVLSRAEHVEFVRYWNRMIRELKSSGTDTSS
jgi:hypothetical protein